ncbi:uncharacterized protein LOC126696516 [Quercus robur]|uniref:uncharacterized protein LOC126696516 n=1 Tax=Quercus robur TaxID=38942 RepID=UPI0021626EBB|nr:uncharacterized protein LOC126696516 [Quercus robur]
MLAALNQFISKFADRCCPFYQLLKKWKGFRWNEKCERAFQDLKEYLMQAPMLTTPEAGEDLFMYLSVSNHAVRAVLLRDQKVQQPVYYIKFSPKNEAEMVCQVECRLWKVFVVGASSAMGAGTGIIIITPEGIRLEHSFRLRFRASNNEAEYETLLAGLRTVLGMGAQDVEIYSDS